MAELLSSYLGIKHDSFEKNGIFDSVIGVDTRLFLDPHLLRKTQILEFKNSRRKIEKYYENIIHLLSVYNKTKNNRAWNEAFKRLNFKEMKGVFMGYGVGTGNGNAIGPKLAKKLLNTAYDIFQMGIHDPVIFELIGLFEEGFGADRLSDMSIVVIKEDIYTYTNNIIKKLEINTSTRRWKIKGKEYILPKHPIKNKPLILLPKELLRDLPVAQTWDAIDHVVSVNRELRERLNKLIGEAWKKKIKKSELRDIIFKDKVNIECLLDAYKKNKSGHYDFDNDPAGEVKWYEIGNQFARDYPCQILETPKDINSLERVIGDIINQFKKLIELNGLNNNLYVKRKPLHERFAQRLFFAVADSYCKANNLDINPEPDSGSGPVDFKLSKGYHGRVLVEIKLTSSKRVIHGFEKQLPAYQESEGTKKSFYVVIKTSESDTQIKQLKEIQEEKIKKGKIIPNVVIIDALIKPSASKRK